MGINRHYSRVLEEGEHLSLHLFLGMLEVIFVFGFGIRDDNYENLQ